MTSELSSSEFGSSVILYSLTEKLDKKTIKQGVVYVIHYMKSAQYFMPKALLICVHFYTSMKEYTSNKKSSLL